MGHGKSSCERDIYNKTGVPQETSKKISDKQTNLPSKEIRKRRTNKNQSQQKEGSNKYQGGNK